MLTFCRIFDIAIRKRLPIYNHQSLISYFVGLNITHVEMYFMNTAQQALLYLVPCLLISTIVKSLYRRELKELYTGKRIQDLLDGTTTLDSSELSTSSTDRQPSPVPIHLGEPNTIECF